MQLNAQQLEGVFWTAFNLLIVLNHVHCNERPDETRVILSCTACLLTDSGKMCITSPAVYKAYNFNSTLHLRCCSEILIPVFPWPCWEDSNSHKYVVPPVFNLSLTGLFKTCANPPLLLNWLLLASIGFWVDRQSSDGTAFYSIIKWVQFQRQRHAIIRTAAKMQSVFWVVERFSTVLFWH